MQISDKIRISVFQTLANPDFSHTSPTRTWGFGASSGYYYHRFPHPPPHTSSYQIPYGYAFPPPVGTEITPRGVIDAAQVQHEQPVVGHVHVVTRDEQPGHAEQMPALGFGARPSSQPGGDDARGPLGGRLIAVHRCGRPADVVRRLFGSRLYYRCKYYADAPGTSSIRRDRYIYDARARDGCRYDCCRGRCAATV